MAGLFRQDSVFRVFVLSVVFLLCNSGIVNSHEGIDVLLHKTGGPELNKTEVPTEVTPGLKHVSDVEIVKELYHPKNDTEASGKLKAFHVDNPPDDIETLDSVEKSGKAEETTVSPKKLEEKVEDVEIVPGKNIPTGSTKSGNYDDIDYTNYGKLKLLI